MKFDEFELKLKEIKKEYKITNGKELTSIQELDKYLFERKFRFKNKSLRSLKGLNI